MWQAEAAKTAGVDTSAGAGSSIGGSGGGGGGGDRGDELQSALAKHAELRRLLDAALAGEKACQADLEACRARAEAAERELDSRAVERQLLRLQTEDDVGATEIKRELADLRARNAELTRGALAASSKAHEQLMDAQDRLALAEKQLEGLQAEHKSLRSHLQITTTTFGHGVAVAQTPKAGSDAPMTTPRAPQPLQADPSEPQQQLRVRRLSAATLATSESGAGSAGSAGSAGPAGAGAGFESLLSPRTLARSSSSVQSAVQEVKSVVAVSAVCRDCLHCLLLVVLTPTCACCVVRAVA